MQYPLSKLVLAAALVGCSAGDATSSPASRAVTAAAMPVGAGHVERWPEATSHLVVTVDGDHVSVAVAAQPASGLVAFWSIASTAGSGSGYFYSDAVQGRSDTSVAFASGVRRVQDIRDASAFDYARPSVGPVERGGIVLFHHVPSDRYLALVLDAITPLDPRTAGAGPYAVADVRWYLTEPGTADFSLAP